MASILAIFRGDNVLANSHLDEHLCLGTKCAAWGGDGDRAIWDAEFGFLSSKGEIVSVPLCGRRPEKLWWWGLPRPKPDWPLGP